MGFHTDHAANKRLQKSIHNRTFIERTPNLLQLRSENEWEYPQPKALITDFFDPFEDHPEAPEVDCLQDQLQQYDWDRDVKPLLDLIPPRSADVVELRHKGVKEYAIAEIFEISQAAVSYISIRAYQRLSFLLRRPKYTPEELRSLLEPTLPEIEVGLCLTLWINPSQTGAIDGETFKTQGRIRHRFLGALRRIHRALPLHPELMPIYQHFRWVQDEKLYNLLIEHDCSDRAKSTYMQTPGKPLSKQTLHNRFRKIYGCTATEFKQRLMADPTQTFSRTLIKAKVGRLLMEIQNNNQPPG